MLVFKTCFLFGVFADKEGLFGGVFGIKLVCPIALEVDGIDENQTKKL